MNRFKKTVLAATAALVLGFGASAYAVMIDGDFSISTGAFAPTGGATVGTATGVDFIPNTFTVDQVNGDFTGFFAPGAGGSIQDFTFAPLGGSIANFLTIGGFSYELDSVNVVFQSDTPSFLVLSGMGTFTGNGFDATPGNWSFSGNSNGGSLSWSGGADAIPNNPVVPEPGTMLLMGSGLLGLGLWRRFKK